MKVKMYKGVAINLHVYKWGSVPIAWTYIKIRMYGHQTKQIYPQLQYIHALFQPEVIVTIPAITRANIHHSSDGYIRDGQWNSYFISHNLNNVSLKTFSYIYITVQWPYHSTCKLHVATITGEVNFLPSDYITRLSDQNRQQ